MNRLIMVLAILILGGLILVFDKKYAMLKDMSTADQKPYSWSKIQLAWWTIIILGSFVSIVIGKGIPVLDLSAVILLGLSSATLGAAKLIDISDKTNTNRHQNQNSQGLFLDILQDENGVSIPRFQAIVLNLVFGIWFLCHVWHNLPIQAVNNIMPVIAQNNLILLGVSAGTYAGLKSTENK